MLWVHTVGQEFTFLPASARATTLCIALPDRAGTDVAVKVQGSGQGLGEVKVVADGELTPLSELLRASVLGLRDGLLMLIQSESGCERAK